MTVGDYNVRYKDDKLTASEPYKGVLCKANTTKVKVTVYSSGDPSQESSRTKKEVGLLASEATSKYDVGVTYTCELGDGEENTFYVLETSGDNVSLIASMNLGDIVAWVTKEDYLAAGGTEDDYRSEGNNKLGPITANKILKERTSGWIKLDEDQITLPSGQQIATAVSNTEWKESTGDSILVKLPTWLNSHTKFTPGTWGYWTSSPNAHYDSYAWIVFYYGLACNSNVVEDDYGYGVRPVITVSKSQLG